MGTDGPTEPAADVPPQLRRFAASLQELGTRRTVDETLQLAIDLATELIDGVDVADVMFVGPQGVTTPVSTDPVAVKLDRAQQDVGEGPCLSTLVSSDRVVSHDLAADDRWPEFTPVALGLGFHAVAAYRLFARRGSGHVQLGALNLFGREPDLDATAVELGQVFATHCAAVLDEAINTEGLETALQTRDVIGQAKGILMERHKVAPDAAYAMLREASNNRNTKLREVAREVADTGELRSD